MEFEGAVRLGRGQRPCAASFRANYPSAEHFSSEVEKVLDEQASRGQFVVLPLNEAVRRYGTRLTIASLAALEKGVDGD